MKKHLLGICACFLCFLCACGSADGVLPQSANNALQSKPKVNIENVPWEVKMGINRLDDRAAMVEFSNNSEYAIKEFDLRFKMKEVSEEKLADFYSHLKSTYNLSDEDLNSLKEIQITMHANLSIGEEDKYIKTGEKAEETLLYGYMYIRTLDYYDLFEPDMYMIQYVDEKGEEHTTYYDYINKAYTEK